MTKIDRVDVYLCVADVEPRGPSGGWYDQHESVLVRLGDADGRTGWGEAGRPAARRGRGGHPAGRELPILAGIKAAHGAGLEMMADGTCGGIGEPCFVAELAALRGRACVPHAWGGVVLLAATLQLLAVTPEPTEVEGSYGGLLEWDVFEKPMRTGLLAEPLAIRDGRVAIPAGPGLGHRGRRSRGPLAGPAVRFRPQVTGC